MKLSVSAYINFMPLTLLTALASIVGEVYVSCLHFVKQTLTLLVGFTFGGFQMWDLATSSLKYVGKIKLLLNYVALRAI